MNTVQIEETYNRIAKEAGISETNVVDNQTYLAANYIDPALYTGIAGILLVVVLAGIMTIYSLYYITMVYKVQEFGKIKAWEPPNGRSARSSFGRGFWLLLWQSLQA